MEFKPFRDAIEAQYNKLQATSKLYTVQIDKDKLWETYLASFSASANPIYRERTEHDCSACKTFVRNIGAVVAIIDDKLVSVWDIDAPNIDIDYLEVANSMRTLIESLPIENIFRFDCRIQLHATTKELLPDSNIKVWSHFSANVAKPFKVVDGSQGQQLGEAKQRKELFQRALTELTPSAVETALDLCESIYRGTEFRPSVDEFRKAQDQFKLAPNPDLWLWSNYTHRAAGIRNTAIGTLLIDLSEGIDVETAVKKFESVVAPANYKRTTAVVTPQMIKNATALIAELGLEPALTRRYATINDISVTNVLWANKASAAVMKNSLEAMLLKDVKPKANVNASATEMSLEDFMQNIVPNAQSIELLLENRHTPNLCSIITESTPNSGKLFKWDNPFSWSYNGGATDSYLTEQVKARGGRVDGAFRFSHSWNELEPNQSLMDLHVFMPGCKVPSSGGGPDLPKSKRVGWNCRQDVSSGGVQDVDYTSEAPKGYIPVENITFPDIKRMPEGVYTCKIHNWQFRSTGGKGTAEIEFNGQLFSYTYPQTKNHEWVTIAEVTLKDGIFTIDHKLPHSQSSKTVWNIQTQAFHKVTAIMHSPNFWDNQTIGNQHTIFTLEDCANPEPTRGIYNEFLSNELQQHRKAFDLIGDKFKCEPIPGNLSGVGFSHTVQNNFTVKVDGRQYTIKVK